jgi:hypothetical protein
MRSWPKLKSVWRLIREKPNDSNLNYRYFFTNSSRMVLDMFSSSDLS